MPLHDYSGLAQAREAPPRLAAGPPGTIIAGSGESHHYRRNDSRAGGLPGRRYKCFDVIDVAGRDKPARPPALQGRSSRVQTNRIIIAGTIGGPAASPAAGTNATRNSNKRTTPSTAYFLYTDSRQWGRNKHSQSSCRSGTNRFPHVRARPPHCR